MLVVSTSPLKPSQKPIARDANAALMLAAHGAEAVDVIRRVLRAHLPLLVLVERAEEIYLDDDSAALGLRDPRVTLAESRRHVATIEALYDPQTFSKDGRTLYVTTDEGGEFTALVSYALDAPKPEKKTVKKEDWDVEEGDFSRTHKYFVTSTNVAGSPKMEVTLGGGGAPVTLPAAPEGGAWSFIRFSEKDRYLAVQLKADTTPDVT